MRSGPAYRTVEQLIAVDVVALEAFGGGPDDPIAAWVTVDGDVVLQVVAPRDVDDWSPDTRERFRAAVRALAATHDLLGRDGNVRVFFDSARTSVDRGTAPLGEPIARADR